MNYTVYYTMVRAALVVALFTVALPSVHAAPYTWHDRQFDTMEEMTSYIKEYLAVWRDVYGVEPSEASTADSAVTTPTQPTHSTGTFAAVSVDTNQAVSIEASRATLQGQLDLNHETYAYVWFEYWRAASTATAQSERVLRTKANDDDFDTRVINLAPLTTYYYRAVAEDALGRTTYGSIRQFTTPVDEDSHTAEIRVLTSTVTDIEDDRVTARGMLTWKKTDYAYVWSEFGESKDGLDNTTGALRLERNAVRQFEQQLRGLRENETYYYRIVAQDADGTRDYGAVKTFKTHVFSEDFVPDVTTGRVDDITYFSALLNGTVDMNDSRNGIVFFVYGEDRTEVSEVAKEYTRYVRIRERGDELQKILLDVDLDHQDSYAQYAAYIDPYTRYYYAIGVQYEDENGDDRIALGYVRSFFTKRQP